MTWASPHFISPPALRPSLGSPVRFDTHVAGNFICTQIRRLVTWPELMGPGNEVPTRMVRLMTFISFYFVVTVIRFSRELCHIFVFLRLITEIFKVVVYI